MAITPQAQGSVNPPNTLTPESAGSVAAPNTLAPESVGSVAAPIARTGSGVLPNLALYSEEFDNAAWGKTDSTIGANEAAAPDGAATADKLKAATTGSVSPRLFQVVTSTASSAYTISAFIKMSEASFLQIWFTTGHVANTPRVNFDLSSGSIGSQDADIDAASITAVGNDWFRISATVTAAGTSLQAYFQLINSAADTRAAANSWVGDRGLYIWGAQIEQSLNATTYAKTTSAAATAGSVSIPNTLTPESAGAVSAPNTLTAEAATTPATPNTLAGSDPIALPRTLCPTVDLNYSAGLFAQNGAAVSESDLITYARASSATYLDRYIKNNKYQYFLNTDYVGTVENLISYSEDMATGGWNLSAATLTEVGEIAPDGTRGVKKLAGDGTSALHALYKPSQSISGKTYSIYAKSAGSRYILLSSHYSSAPLNRGASFDIVTGNIVSAGAGVSAKIAPSGDGWFRCSITEGDSASTIFSVNLSNDGSTVIYADDAESGVLVWGAQRTEGTAVLPYVKTLSSSASQTFAESQRIEYDAETGECLGALIEQGSTNLCLRSEEFDNASWAKTSAAATANDTQAPDLATAADKLESSVTSTVSPSFSQSVTVTASSVYTFSVYVKRSEASFVQLRFGGSQVANDPRVNFGLSSGAIGTQDADIASASIMLVGNDWLKISATVTAATTTLTPVIVLIKSLIDSRDQANSWSAGDGLYIWGAQIEQAAIPTSYIPTTTAAVSRLADSVTIPVNSNLSAGSTSFSADVNLPYDTGVTRFVYDVASGGSEIDTYVSSSNALSTRYGTGVANALNDGYQGRAKIASVFDKNASTIALYVDSELIESTSAGDYAEPASGANIGLGRFTSSLSNFLNGHMKRFTIYDEALTAAEVSLL